MMGPITVTFSPTYECAKQASAAAAPMMQTAAMRYAGIAYNTVQFVLTAVGTFSIILFFLDAAANITYLYVLLAAAILTYGFYALNSYLYRAGYAQFTKTAFGASNTIAISETGFQLIASHSRWDTHWRDVTQIFKTENTLGIITPVLPIYLPTSALSDPSAVFAQMHKWHTAASDQRS